MTAINDATLQQAGTIYQYLIALKDCFEMEEGQTLQIETNGDVSIISSDSSNGKFQKEVKHHFNQQNLSDRDIDFWKTLANWYEDYERIEKFANLILHTTSNINASSPFYGWNELNDNEKLKTLVEIASFSKPKETGFREQYNRIFNNTYDKNILLSILRKFTIKVSQATLAGISHEFTKYVGHIPAENRDRYIGALMGVILIKVKDPPHKWEVTRAEFETILQEQTTVHGKKGVVPLPHEFAKAVVSAEDVIKLEDKQFVAAIREIEYDEQIPDAIADYWKATLTIGKYFQDDPLYLTSLDAYKEDLTVKMSYAKSTAEIDADGVPYSEKIKLSKKLYNTVMQWDAKDFGSIIRNQGFFQRGVIQNIVDEQNFRWKAGKDKNEHS